MSEGEAAVTVVHYHAWSNSYCGGKEPHAWAACQHDERVTWPKPDERISCHAAEVNCPGCLEQIAKDVANQLQQLELAD